MSRSGYTDDGDQWELIRWRGAVASAIRGKRGQAFLREMLAAMDALPEPRLIAGELITNEGEVCAIGSVAKARGTSVDGLDVYDREAIAETMGIAEAMTAEIEYQNDEHGPYGRAETPEERFIRVRAWCESHLAAMGGE